MHPSSASSALAAGGPPLVAHVIHHLVIGGLENGLVNLINWAPPQRYRHAIVCMTDFSDFSRRIQRPDVQIFAMNKREIGQDFGIFPKLYRLFRRIRPQVVHSRNLTALDSLVPAALAGVPVRIHGEHGRDAVDPDGTSTKRQIVRRLFRPLVHRYITVSQDLESYLQAKIGVPTSRITQIYNGVDASLFHPAGERRDAPPHPGFAGPDHFVIGSVGRMQEVKDPLNLARAFVRLMQIVPDAARRLRLVMVGDGPLLESVRSMLGDSGASECVWLAGKRDDVARIMRSFDLFVLPSRAEGISNTVLEAMATGLPVLATAVGGNTELVQPGVTGTLVPRDDPESMAQAMRAYAESTELRRRHGSEARRTIERKFRMEVMVDAYLGIYDELLARHRRR